MTELFDRSKLKTIPLAQRRSKVSIDDFGCPLAPSPDFDWFLGHLPNQLAAKNFKRLCAELVRVKKEGKPCIVAIGGHVIKTGCSPYIIDFMKRGIVTTVAMNGAAAIHDLEIAMIGKTSEDVEAGLEDGTFGCAEETAEAFYSCLSSVFGRDNLGSSLGTEILETCTWENSILGISALLGTTCTVHVAFGADIVHMHAHESGDAAKLGKKTIWTLKIPRHRR